MEPSISNPPQSNKILKKALELYHPQWINISRTVQTLNQIGVNPKIIAASLGLNDRKSFYGWNDWNDDEILRLL